MLFAQQERIDVVVPCIEKDLPILHQCLTHLRKNVEGLGRIIILSPKKLTDQAEWASEEGYPFTREDVRCALLEAGIKNPRRDGWYYQQLLKWYLPFVIPNLSNNVLIFDSDTIMLHPMRFLDEEGRTIFNVVENPGTQHFIQHAQTLHPSFTITRPDITSVTHHMLFQRDKVKAFMELIEEHHKVPFWMAFLKNINLKKWKIGVSEFESYFTYILNHHPNGYVINHCIRMDNEWKIELLREQKQAYLEDGVDFVSYHHTVRWTKGRRD